MSNRALRGLVGGFRSDRHGIFEHYSTMGTEGQDAIREISRRTGLSRNIIRKHLRADIVEPSFRTPTRPSKLDPFAEKLSGWLLTEQLKSRKERRKVKQMHSDLVQLGFDGPFERVAAFVRALCLLPAPKVIAIPISRNVAWCCR